VNECAGVYKTTFDAVEAVGIAIVFSAGNGGPTPLSITKPKNINTDLVNVFCVANVDGNQVGVPIANLSSRGPSTCGGTGSLNIKPEVAAPGTDVRSCYKGDYSQLSGTSMAAPHVCGAIALLKEPFPYLTGSEIKLALYNTCFDLGSPGEDNTYGMGIIDLPAAYNYLIGQGNTPVIPPVNDAAAINVLGVNSFVCDTTPQPSVVIENRGTNPLTSSTIRYSIDQGDTMTVTWIGSLAPMDTVHVPLPDLILPHGTYEFAAHLVLPNGVADERTFNDKIRRAMVIPEFTNVASKNICASESTTLTATAPTSGAVSWFDQPDSSIAIAQGLTYSTPALNTTTIYYSDIRDTMFIGKPDTAGGGNYQTSTTRYLIFDCFNPFTLVSVKVYCSVAGPKTVELRDSQGNILDLVTVSIPVGESRVTLNFEVVPGLDYRLGISGSANLFRNNNLVFFPYTIPGVLSIKTSDQGPKFYYYYYDWEIAYWGPCGRIAAPVYVNSAISANVVYTPAEYDLVTDQEVSFQDNTVGAVSWLWDFGDGVSSTEQNVTHSYANFPRTYNVELFVADSGSICKDSISFVYEVISSAEDVVFPNPSSGNFTLDLKLIQTDGLTVTLYDITGKILLDGWFYQASSTLLSVDLSSLADGSYIIVVELSDRKITERLVKVSD
ncbi:MAG: S8 family serine peptidase, partial [Flavobacteriales bacterium]|nr:S8 family serine peptidase [Flavobacteriales bacterium]